MTLPALFRMDFNIIAEPANVSLLLLHLDFKLCSTSFVHLRLWRQSPLQAVRVLCENNKL